MRPWWRRHFRAGAGPRRSARLPSGSPPLIALSHLMSAKVRSSACSAAVRSASGPMLTRRSAGETTRSLLSLRLRPTTGVSAVRTSAAAPAARAAADQAGGQVTVTHDVDLEPPGAACCCRHHRGDVLDPAGAPGRKLRRQLSHWREVSVRFRTLRRSSRRRREEAASSPGVAAGRRRESRISSMED